MAQGRKPKPTHLKVVQGNPGKRALPANEPKPKRDRPRKPANLDGTASKIWDVLAGETDNMGVLTTADGPALRMLCEAWSDFFEAKRIISAYGSMTYETVGAAGKMVKLHPAQKVKENADSRIRQWFTEFGLTPSARSKVERAFDEDEGDTIDDLFTGGSAAG